ncbi:hypothetical protein ACHAXH_005040 [Discostella pseudostelligera]
MPSSSTVEDLPSNLQSLLSQAKALYEQSFANDDNDDERTPLPIHCASAPGRVNLIGEHTDYTGGYVLPLAIGYNTLCYGRGDIVKVDSTKSSLCRIVSMNDPTNITEFRAIPTSPPSSADSNNKWANYVQGTILQYLPDLKDDETFALDMAVNGDVPLGSGLSSSASLEVATAGFLECIMDQHDGVAYSSYKTNHGNADTSPSSKERKMERAIRCQRAENVFVGVPCGIMDQFVSSAGSKGNLLLIDCRSLDFREVSVVESSIESEAPVLVVANSNVKHDLGGGEYPIRVRQCKEATEILSKVNPRIQSLRDASMEDIDNAISTASLDGVLLQRARHVVSENARTVETANAWARADWAVVGELMNASHTSMKNDYEVSCKEIDVLVDLAQKFDGVYGSRLTGGGFGGCTVTLVTKSVAQALVDYLNVEYEKATGMKCSCFETSPGDGAMAISVL